MSDIKNIITFLHKSITLELKLPSMEYRNVDILIELIKFNQMAFRGT